MDDIHSSQLQSEKDVYDFKAALKKNGLKIPPREIEILQANITYLCNQQCRHCHVEAGPKREEMMPEDVWQQCIRVLETDHRLNTLDLTGGAPELHTDFDRIVRQARSLGKHVIVRHNLTVSDDVHPQTGAAMAYLPEFFVDQQVELVSSLPYYQAYFTDRQRGDGVFSKSVAALQRLNQLGYGQPDSDLKLNLVFNPAGAFLPGDQQSLETDFKRALEKDFGVVFNQLYTITNMPIFRFRRQLKNIGVLEEYWKKLVEAFNPCAAEAVMCRNQISVKYDGTLYDCDFNQMLGLPILLDNEVMTIFSYHREKLLQRQIRVAPHCFGCTAGAGSSCGGATT